MTTVNVITENLEVWTSALLKKTAGSRGNNGKQEAYGTKKLRELVLELAVRGKLVFQDANDEPASVLMEKIAREKEQLTKEGKLTKQKPLPKIAKDEPYFSLPPGWSWCRLGDVTNYGIAEKAEPGAVDEATWVLDLEDVEKETSRLLQKIRYSEKSFQSSKNRFAKGDVVYGKLRPYLDKVIVADEDGVCTTEMIPVRGYFGLSPFYLRLVMKTPHFIKYANDSTHGMNLPRLGTDKARMALFPLAPYAEQHRIVAKVDELMAVCNQLEQQHIQSFEAQQTLVEVLLGALICAKSQRGLSKAWTRIANHFDTLVDTEHSVDRLKRTILQLAVMGKLVPQDASDAPASVVLERIAEAKKKFRVDVGSNKQEALLVVAEEEIPYQLPSGWEWARFIDVLDFQGGSQPPKSRFSALKLDRYVQLIQIRDLGPSPQPVFVPIESVSKFCTENDIMIGRYGASVGKVFWGKDGAYNVALIKLIDEYGVYEKTFLFNLMQSPLGQGYFSGISRSAQDGFSKNDIAHRLVPIAPLDEQHRIVAKVNELFALCDGLEARLAAAQSTQVQLAAAVVERAADAQCDPDSSRTCGRHLGGVAPIRQPLHLRSL